ncbi:hypothetical protein NDU88_009905 [Pleurodeles waltl]|uniref:Uncharacterized protein n=1 Tax=Pleurodeles waltl TaxID=8319 RepID=A0AAV7S1R3_PLEWA|nr:hypothetical protein NDU88_009905 [Pleurodeles waltl]
MNTSSNRPPKGHTHMRIDHVPLHCLLGYVKRPKGRKISYKFMQLALVLAQCRVAITEMGHRAPVVEQWYGDAQEGALAGEVHIKQSRRNDKLGNDVRVWRYVRDTFLTPLEEMESTASNESVSAVDVGPLVGGELHPH